MATTSPPSDWQVGKKLSECFDHLLTSGIGSDVTFLVGEEKTRISAHKLVLLSRSPVFYAMFEGPLAEKGEITIPDISPDTFNLFLRYLYTDYIEMPYRSIFSVLQAARKYCVDTLVSYCEESLTWNLLPNTVCVLLEQARQFMEDKLQAECMKFIEENATLVLQDETFSELGRECVEYVTSSDDLQVVERRLYDAVMQWADAECSRQNIETTADNKREVLGEILYNVRYIHISDDFLEGKVRSDMILDPEYVDNVIDHKKFKSKLILNKLNTKKRLGFPMRFFRKYAGYKAVNGHWATPPEDEAISFKTSVDVFMFGFGSFFTKVDGSSVDFKIYEDNVCLVEDTKPRERPQPDTPSMGDVLLDTPIRIQAGKTYTVLEHSHHPVYHYFEFCSSRSNQQHITVEFSDSFKSSCTDQHRGQIPYLILSEFSSG